MQAFFYTASLVVSSLDVIIAFRKSKNVTNKISVLVKTVKFVMVNIYNVYKNQVGSANVELLAGKDTLVALFKMRRWTHLTIRMFSNNPVAVGKEFVLRQCGANSILGLGKGRCVDLLA